MKLNYHFLTHELNGETLIVPTAGADFHGLIQGNKTTAAIVECLQQDTTEAEIADALCERFDGDRAQIEADVSRIIARLREVGAIDD